MKTIEFKLYLTKSEQKTIDEWLAALKYVWNEGNRIIKQFNSFNYYNKPIKKTLPCCPILSYNHKHRDVILEGFRREDRGHLPSCPIGSILSDWEEGQKISDKHPSGIFPVHSNGVLVWNLTYFGLLPAFAHKQNPDKPWLTAVPSKFVAGTVEVLATAWKAFLAGKRKPPKFKKKNDRVDTLIHNNSKDIRISGDRINIPKLGYVKARGLSKRWPQGLAFCPMKICRKASGYYLQLTGKVPSAPEVKPKIKAVGLDPGIEHIYTDDRDRKVKSPAYADRGTKRLKELQRKAQRQWDNNHKNKEWDRKNWRKTQKKIAKLHEKIARRRRAFNHFQSTKITRQFQNIFIEDYHPSEIIKKVEPLPSGNHVVNVNDDWTTVYDENGRFLNRKTNKKAANNAVGQLWEMIKTKGGDRVVRIEAAGTSSECPKCGFSEAKQLKDRIHHCPACGYKVHRDTAAAQIIKKRGLFLKNSANP